MTPQFDTRRLLCKQRQQARVKSSHSLGFPRIAASGAESYQLHAPSVVWSLSVRAGASIAHSNARQSRSGGRRRVRQSIPTLLHGTNAQPATRSWECRERCPATCYARIDPPSAYSEKRMGCRLLANPNRPNRHWSGQDGIRRYWESNGGKRTGKVSWILIGHFAARE